MWAAAFCLAGTIAARAAGIPGLVTNWGDPGENLGVFPGGILTNVTAVSCGFSNNLALKADGTMVAWGAGVTNTGISPDYGQSIIPAGLKNVTAIAAGSYHTLALSNGIVLAWGLNSDGQTSVPTGLNSVAAIAAGSVHSMALRSNGTVVAWGYNGFGETNVPAGLTNVAAISGGDIHCLALLSNGTVAAWGGNLYGQTNVPSGLTNAVAIAAGMDHSLALRADGTVAAWGYNGSGETNVPAGLTNVMAIAAGGHQSVAITSNGLITVWGAISNLPATLANVESAAADGTHGLLISLSPVLLTNPPVDIFLNPNASTNFDIAAWSGSPLRYQWSFDNAPVSLATNAGFAVSNFVYSNAGAYAVTVSNSFNYLTATTFVRPTNSPVIYINGSEVGGGPVAAVSSAQVTMLPSGAGTAVYYTLDGSTPGFTSARYAGAFTLTNSAVINAVGYDVSYTISAQAAPIDLQVSPVYALAATTPGGGSIGESPPPYSNNVYVSNTVVTLTATPAAGWTFLDWTGDSTSASNVITLPMNQPHSVQAVFGLTPAIAIVGNGQVQLSPSNGPYAYGTTVQLTAVPASGDYFYGWANGASGFANPLSLDVVNTNSITALFAPLASNDVTLQVTTTGSGTGSVAVSPAASIYTNGQTVTLTASPGSNSVFSAWGGAVPSSSTNPLVTMLTSNETITATFVSGTQTNIPIITVPPQSRTLPPGAAALLSFQATGPGPFTYQWLFDSTNIPGATAPTLRLTNFNADQAGNYAIALTGFYGETTSPPASVAMFEMQLVPGESSGQIPLLILNGAPGSSYQFQYITDLTLTNWTPLENTTLTGTTGYFIDTPASSNSQRFYRAVPW